MEYSDKKRYMDRLAQVVRIITVPPFMVAILLCFLYFKECGINSNR